MPKNLTKPFLLLLVFLVIVGCYLIFRPFLTELFVAMVLASIFYRPFEFLVSKLKGRRNLAAFIMCLLLILIVVIPSVRIIIYAGQKSVTAYSQAVEFFNNNDLSEVLQSESLDRGVFKFFDIKNLIETNEELKTMFLDILKKSSNWMISGATTVVKETTNFLISLVLIIIAMFFFFVEGKNVVHRLMHLSPLPNHYDKEIFAKFRAVSYSTFVSSFVAAAGQGIAGAIGFAIVGFPALLAGVIVALLSLLPYIGSMIFYVPVGIYYLLIGSIWQGIFILIWGFLVIGTVDNIIRAFMIRGKAEVNAIFVLFSILGGIVLFGFWGIVLGPLIVALATTIFHIYELEFCGDLERCNNQKESSGRKEKDDEENKDWQKIKEVKNKIKDILD
ncbi:MAG: AI-2E family transporter [Patescibacteria group bacterium]|jgi:predicted PurR-regulated permease PerM|nr:AI-2E family transporter [bacterium]HQC49570.1 AI-2E family transporter [bacterium]